MIAVVTGASGFIGTNLVAALVADGAEVRVLRRPHARYASTPPGIRAVALDLTAPGAVDSPIWRGATHVFHLAARTRALRPDAFTADNVTPTERLCDTLARLATPPRLIFVSSQAAAGPASSADRPVTDDDAPRPVDPYGRSKRDAEAAVRAHAPALPWVIVRPSSVYGPHDRDFLQVFQWMRRPIVLQAVAPTHQLSLSHVSDVVAALRLAAVNDRAMGRTFFVEDGAPTTWQAIYDDVGAVLRRAPRRYMTPAPVLRTAAVASELAARVSGRDPLLTRAKLEMAQYPHWLCDATGLRTTLGWRPAVSRPAGWALTYEWYKEARWIRS